MESEEKNKMLVMVLIDLATICDKLIENPAVPEELRGRASEFVSEFNMLLPNKGQGTALEHFKGEALIVRIARFLPRLLEIQAAPASVSHG
jgi:hypothetical protein